MLAVNEVQLHQLLTDDKFIHAQYLPAGQTDLEQGTVTSVLGMRVQASTLVPNGVAYAVDTRVASVMLLRRDVTVEDWEDIKAGNYGVRATTRFGVGVKRDSPTARSRCRKRRSTVGPIHSSVFSRGHDAGPTSHPFR